MNRWKRPLSSSAPWRPAPSIQSNLSLLVSRHEQLKVSFHELNSEIRTGLIEVEDVFASLAIPLMKLVGLKTVEMASEGRFSTVIFTADEAVTTDDDFVSNAMTASNELITNQKVQLMKLINILKTIQAQVNESQHSIFETLAKHQHFMKKFFFQAITHVSEIHQSNGRDELSLLMLQLLKASFDQVRGALGSVEVGVEDMMSELSGILCKPMAQYVKGLKVEMTNGACPRLLEVIKEMDGAMRLRKFELEEARNMARLAEQSRAETLSKLLKSEETAKQLTTSLGLLIGTDTDQEEQQLEAKDDTLNSKLWEFRRKKRKCNMPESPVGPKELLGLQKYDRRFNVTRAFQSSSHLPVTRSQTERLNPHSFTSSRLLLGSSPTARTQVALRKRKSP